MTRPRRILVTMSSHADLGVSGKKTGTWFEEVATPYYVFTEAGFQVVFASPRGGEAPLDHLSLRAPFTTANTDRFLDDPAGTRAIRETAQLADVDHRDFDALFFPGGYGLLWDLAADSRVIRMVEHALAGGTPVAMVCHAPGILRDVKSPDGTPYVAGRTVTGFANTEDDELDLSRHLLFSLEDDLIMRGANFTRSTANWLPNVVQDGPLITGQNPASAPVIAKTLTDHLA
ncbi:type 1 glutamine amidotransferase domain-containing protein [Actinokineospora sp. NBRC 105648]|uniref:type 1 glutamine amidotransferase domain-containing protein n=1 Tax=Actinokineospora sp. NBRC 105648 TaxID=3032206 RepID=UPI0024A2F824|nr:type 1 glutamine amidotransferase domain-containing protein [Actinokineospora sp. NBRC 105648]GLZ39914.1 dimethylallyltransferase [Actinokineospora sp. NBRC 105648]